MKTMTKLSLMLCLALNSTAIVFRIVILRAKLTALLRN